MQPTDAAEADEDRLLRLEEPGVDQHMGLQSNKVKLHPSSDLTRVLFIAGALRSGSTLLDRVIGAREGFCSVGEAHTIWKGSFEENQLCGCGVSFHECPFWDKVSRRAFGVTTVQFDPANTIHLRDSVDRIRHSPWLLSSRRPRSYQTALSAYGELTERLYAAIQAVSGARVIVDSSKSPAHALVLAQLPGVEVHVVHLVRDPRAVAFSWQRKPQRTHAGIHWKAGDMPIERVSTSAVRWMAHNALAEFLSASTTNYCRLRYEDFLADPDAALSKILAPYEWPKDDPTRAGSMEIVLEPAHTVSGNRMRFKSGKLRLTLDDEWRGAMSKRDRQTVEATTWPLLIHYGYHFGSDI